MRTSRLWPVLTVLAALLVGTALMEWAANNHEAQYEVVHVTNSAGVEEGDDEMSEPTWQSITPTSAEHARARELLRRGDIEQSVEIYTGLVGGEETPVPLLAEYAFALRRAGRCDEAQPIGAQALERAPDDGAVNLAVALTHRCLDNNDEAGEAFERALELRPNHTQTRLAYGEFLRRRGAFERAIEVLEPASQQGSNDERARALASLGRCLTELGRTRRARNVLEEAIERAPANISIWVSVAQTYLRSDDRDDHVRALHSATQASNLAPEAAAPHSAMGRAYEKLDLRLDAIASYRRAVQLDPKYEWALVRLVRLSLQEEEYALARRSARGLLDMDPDEAEYLFFYALAAARTDDVDAARVAYNSAIEARDGAFAAAWYNLGLLERDAGQYEAAIVAYRRAVEERPEYEAAWNNLGLVYHDVEQYEEAEAAFSQAVLLREDYVAPWMNLGKTYAAQDLYWLAAGAYERALEIEPTDRTLRLRLGVAYRRTDRIDLAIATYLNLVGDEPRYVNAYYNLGIAYSAADRDTEARRAYTTALRIDPNHRRSLENLGVLEVEAGLLGQARSHLNAALDLDPADTQVRLRLAQLMYEEGDLARCARYARVVLAQHPETGGAQELLNRCAP